KRRGTRISASFLNWTGLVSGLTSAINNLTALDPMSIAPYLTNIIFDGVDNNLLIMYNINKSNINIVLSYCLYFIFIFLLSLQPKSNHYAMSTKEQKIANFDPSQPGLAGANIYGLPFTPEESEIIIVPVPWEVTVSYGAGASLGPTAILEASFQVDLLHQEFPDLWKLGIYMDEAPEHWTCNS